MEISEFDQGTVRVIEPKGRIDSATSARFGEHLRDLMQSDVRRIVVDFSGIVYLSSAGLRSLLLAGRQAKEGDIRLVLCGLRADVKRVFEISRFDQMFTIYATREDGVRNIS